MGIPPATAVGTESVQILGSSVLSEAMATGLKKNIDYELDLFLLIGVFWLTLEVILFNF